MKKYIWLALIVVLAAVVRFVNLTSVPPALNSDEVAIGYNAYSILKTGKDEYGAHLPFTFRSFDDYKMPVYVYLVAGSMSILGDRDFAVRFPSALVGTVTVLLTFFLVKELFKKSHDSQLIGLVSAFLVSISPWHIHFSRSGYEANVAVGFIVLGMYLFLRGLERGWLLPLSSFFLSLSIWTYLTPRLFIPLLIVGFGVIYRKELWKKKWWALLGIVIAICMLIPILRMTISEEGRMRASGVSAFANQEDLRKSVSRILIDQKNNMSFLTLLDNRRITYGITFLRGYFAHFDPNFLFLDKSIDKYRAPDMGLMYLFELPLLLMGIYMLVSAWSKASAGLFWWIVVAPVAAAFTLQLPHPVRTLVFLPTFQILSAVGLVTLWNYVLNRVQAGKKNLFVGVGILIISMSVLYYMHQYFSFLPVESAADWYVGRSQMAQKIQEYRQSYDEVFVSNSLDFPYIFYLYYGGIDPARYHELGGTVSGGFTEQNNTYENIHFRSISPSLRKPLVKSLFVGLPSEVFAESIILDTVYYPDGSAALVFFR